MITMMFWVIIIFSKKRISNLEMYTTTLFALYFEAMVNVYLDLKYDLFGYFHKGVDWATLPIITLLYPAVNILFLNFYPYKRSTFIKALYILLSSIISIFFEWVFLQTSFFYYNSWKLWYSLLLYPIIFITLLANLKLIRFFQSKDQ
ncbi:CBO0543 family protein [Heyndrickxia camelliae]